MVVVGETGVAPTPEVSEPHKLFNEFRIEDLSGSHRPKIAATHKEIGTGSNLSPEESRFLW